MQTTQGRKPLRWRVADRLTGRNARLAVWSVGGLVIVVLVLLTLFRPYVGRPLKMGPDGVEVEQTQIDCPAARTALTRSFNKAAIVPDQTRVCIETGRARAFSTGLFVALILLITWAATHIPEGGRRRSHEESARWDRAIARAKSRADRQNGTG